VTDRYYPSGEQSTA